LLSAGIAFYERLLALGDIALSAGGLSRPEAEAALAELRDRAASPQG
jgi:hypothetical protein